MGQHACRPPFVCRSPAPRCAVPAALGFWAECWVQGYGSQAVPVRKAWWVFFSAFGPSPFSVGALCLLLSDGVCLWERVSPWEPLPFVVLEGGWGGSGCLGTWRETPERGAFSPGLPSPQSESPCWSYTEKAGFRVAGQRSRSHEGVGQGWNPLGTLAPPRSECAAGKREPAAPGELLRVPRVRGGQALAASEPALPQRAPGATGLLLKRQLAPVSRQPPCGRRRAGPAV